MANFGTVPTNTQLDRQIVLTGGAIGRGSTAPTEVEIGAGPPTVQVLLFDAVGETVNIYQAHPFWVNTAANIELILVWQLVVGQTNGDTADWTLDYVAPIALSTGNGIGKASTQITAQTVVSTSNGLAAGDMYTSTFTFANGDGTNPLGSSNGLGMELHLTNETGVGDIHLSAACFNYLNANY